MHGFMHFLPTIPPNAVAMVPVQPAATAVLIASNVGKSKFVVITKSGSFPIHDVSPGL
jgi:hypothetical protein